MMLTVYPAPPRLHATAKFYRISLCTESDLHNVIEERFKHALTSQIPDTRLFIEPAPHHHWDVEVSFNRVISLAKTVNFPRTSGALHGEKRAVHHAVEGHAH